MIRKKAAPRPFTPKPGRPVALLGLGERITLAVYVKRSQSRHEFAATVVGQSILAIRLMFTSGPPSSPLEHFVWIPKSWELMLAPRCTGVYWLSSSKVDELGLFKVLTFN